jgi:hypothetical protein
VTRHEFYFALEVSSQGVPPGLLDDLASHVLDHLGCRREKLTGLPEALQRAADTAGAGGNRCDVQFRAQGGALQIIVTANGGRIWQTSTEIP